MAQLSLPTPVFFAPGVPFWDTANSNDALNGTTLTVTGNGTIGGTFIVTGNGTYSNNLSVSNVLNCGSNLTVSNAITAGVVNTLNSVTSLVTTGGVTCNVTAGTATVIVATTPTFSFVTGATYMVNVPFSASLTSPVYVTSNSPPAGNFKLFGCSATAFPIVANGVTPGITFTCVGSNNSSDSGNIRFTAVAQATVSNEAIQIAGVPVGNLSNASLSVQINPTAINRISVTRIA